MTYNEIAKLTKPELIDGFIKAKTDLIEATSNKTLAESDARQKNREYELVNSELESEKLKIAKIKDAIYTIAAVHYPNNDINAIYNEYNIKPESAQEESNEFLFLKHLMHLASF